MNKLKTLLQGVVAVLVVVGVPVLLVRVAGNPLPARMPDWSNVWRSLRQNDIRAGVVIDVLAIVAWVVWALIVWAIVWEVAVNVPAMLSGRQLRRAPGVPAMLGVPVAHIVFAVVTLVMPLRAVASTSPAVLPATVPNADLEQVQHDAPVVSGAVATETSHSVEAPTWTVERGDTLWAIAERTLGDGNRVDEIVTLNPDYSDVRRLPVGVVLTLPADAIVNVAAGGAGGEVVVVKGDTLWDLTEEQTGTVDMDQIADVAARNEIENPDLIYPGQVISFDDAVTEPEVAVAETALSPEAAMVESESVPATTATSPDGEVAESPEISEAVPSSGLWSRGAAEREPVAGSVGQPNETSPPVESLPAPSEVPVVEATPTSELLPPPSGGAEAAPVAQERSMFPGKVWLFGSAVVGSLAMLGAWRLLAERRRRRQQWMGVQPAPVVPPVDAETTREVFVKADVVALLRGGVDVGVRGIVIGDDEVEVLLSEPCDPPVGWDISGAGWMTSTPVEPVPVLSSAVATVGVDDDGTEILIDVLSVGEVAIVGDRQAAESLMCAMAFELAASSTRVALVGLSCRSAMEARGDVEFLEVADAAAVLSEAGGDNRDVVVFVDSFGDDHARFVDDIRAAVSPSAAVVWAGPLHDAVEVVEVPSATVMRWAGLEATPTGLSEDDDEQLSAMLAAVQVGQSASSRSRAADPEAAAAFAREANSLASHTDTVSGVATSLLERGPDQIGGPAPVDIGQPAVPPEQGSVLEDPGVGEAAPMEVEPPRLPVIHPVEWPLFLLTACTEKIGVLGADPGDSQIGLAVPFLLAALGRGASIEELASQLGCSPKTLSNVVSTDHLLIDRANGELQLRDNVGTDFGWPRECVRQLSAAVADDSPEWRDWLVGAFDALSRVKFAPYSTAPTTKRFRAAWQWVDEVPASMPARYAAESSVAQAALGFAALYGVVEADMIIDTDAAIKMLCDIAAVVPTAAVTPLDGSEWVNSGEALLVAAIQLADGHVTRVRKVRQAARALVAFQQIQATDELADALGL